MNSRYHRHRKLWPSGCPASVVRHFDDVGQTFPDPIPNCLEELVASAEPTESAGWLKQGIHPHPLIVAVGLTRLLRRINTDYPDLMSQPNQLSGQRLSRTADSPVDCWRVFGANKAKLHLAIQTGIGRRRPPFEELIRDRTIEPK